MSELPLFAQAHRRRSAPARSAGTEVTRAAAAAAIAGHAAGMREEVLGFIRAAGEFGATDEEVSSRLRLKLDSSRARRCELRDAGLIRDSGKRRPTVAGRAAVVWIVARAPATPVAVRSSTGRPGETETLAARMIGRQRAGCCPWCGSAKWWRSTYGVLVCAACHPPAVPELVAEWIGQESQEEARGR